MPRSAATTTDMSVGPGFMASRDETVASSSPTRRSLVFISHANPEDNDFARWLGAQLACSGYEVWCDVIKLLGGELFWDDIEHAIGEQAAKIVVALSQASANKSGVLDEIAFAINTERGRKLRNFVIPIRLDDLDFSRLRANVTRKNVIDFKGSWATGLAQLLKVLERDAVPRGRVGPIDVARWSTTRLDPAYRVQALPEPLLSNWLQVLALPPEIRMFGVGIEKSQIPNLIKPCKMPTFLFQRLVGAFGTEADLRRDLPQMSRRRLNIEFPPPNPFREDLRGCLLWKLPKLGSM
jgi:hypothetical protein